MAKKYFSVYASAVLALLVTMVARVVSNTIYGHGVASWISFLFDCCKVYIIAFAMILTLLAIWRHFAPEGYKKMKKNVLQKIISFSDEITRYED